MYAHVCRYVFISVGMFSLILCGYQKWIYGPVYTYNVHSARQKSGAALSKNSMFPGCEKYIMQNRVENK